MTTLVPLVLPSTDQVESVQAKPVGEGRVMIVDVPAFSDLYGFADVVATEDRNGVLYASDIVDRGSWGTFALMFDSKDAVRITERLKGLEREGCIVHLRNDCYCSLGVPSEDMQRIGQMLETGEKEGFWRAALMLRR